VRGRYSKNGGKPELFWSKLSDHSGFPDYEALKHSSRSQEGETISFQCLSVKNVLKPDVSLFDFWQQA
jgi:hypothetical protein